MLVGADCALCTNPTFLQIVGVGGYLNVDFTTRFGFVILIHARTVPADVGNRWIKALQLRCRIPWVSLVICSMPRRRRSLSM
jgi:hypothetical protein